MIQMSTLKKLGQFFSEKALRSLSTGIAVSSIMLGLGAFSKPASAVVLIGGIEVDTNALADILLESANVTSNGNSVESAILDGNVATTVFASTTPGAYVKLGFSNPILNSVGDDLALFELGLPDRFSVKINGQTFDYETYETGDFTDNPVRSINLATLDFNDFGIALGDYVSEILIKLDNISTNYGTTPALGLVAGIRSVPEPSAMFGLLATAGFLACQRKQIKAVKKGISLS
jgi:hypothetical protein